MTESTRIISDILEISRDIKDQKKKSKIKFLAKIIEKININKLKRRIKSLRSKNIILDKFMLQEFFTYILSINDNGHYRDITGITLSDDSENTMTIHILLFPSEYNMFISMIRYTIVINNRPGISITYSALDFNGSNYNSGTYTTTDLWYSNNVEFYNHSSYNNNLVIKILNTELLKMIESFLLEQIKMEEEKVYAAK